MSGLDYWLGVATPFVVLLAGWAVLSVVAWVRWWFIDPQTFRGGWGYAHEFQSLYPENGRWGTVQHTHWWPPDTPRWLGRLLEPLRVRICLRDPDHRPLAAQTDDEATHPGSAMREMP